MTTSSRSGSHTINLLSSKPIHKKPTISISPIVYCEHQWSLSNHLNAVEQVTHSTKLERTRYPYLVRRFQWDAAAYGQFSTYNWDHGLNKAKSGEDNQFNSNKNAAEECMEGHTTALRRVYVICNQQYRSILKRFSVPALLDIVFCKLYFFATLSDSLAWKRRDLYNIDRLMRQTLQE